MARSDRRRRRVDQLTKLYVIVEIAREYDDPARTGLGKEAGFLVSKCGPGQPGYESARA